MFPSIMIDLESSLKVKADWADYYAAILKERYPEAAQYLSESWGTGRNLAAEIDAKLEGKTIIHQYD